MTSLANQSSRLRLTQEEAVGKEESPLRRKRELFLFLLPGDRALNSASVPSLLWAGLAVLNM